MNIDYKSCLVNKSRIISCIAVNDVICKANTVATLSFRQKIKITCLHSALAC